MLGTPVFEERESDVASFEQQPKALWSCDANEAGLLDWRKTRRWSSEQASLKIWELQLEVGAKCAQRAQRAKIFPDRHFRLATLFHQAHPLQQRLNLCPHGLLSMLPVLRM